MLNKDQVAPYKVAVYMRVSTDDQVEKYGLDIQEDAVKSLVASKGKLDNGQPLMILAGEQYIYVDDGVSGTIDLEDRPGFARLQEDILYASEGERPFDFVAVYKLDRFARKLKILLEAIEFFEKYDIQFTSATESIDTSTPFGRAMVGIIGVIAELERETILQRTSAGREQAVKKGVGMGSTVPFGYTKNKEKLLIPFDEESVVVKLIFNKFTTERFSVQQIANFLKENEYLSPDASAVTHQKRQGEIRKKNTLTFWRPEQVRKILQDEVYIGKYYYNKTKNNKRLPKEEWLLSQVKHIPIIDLLTFEKAQIILKQHLPLVAKHQTDDHIYLLSGLLRCEYCNTDKEKPEEMMNWTGSKKKLIKGKNAGAYTYSYFCNRKNRIKNSIVCKVMPIPADPLEKYIVAYTKELLDKPIAVYKYQQNLKSTLAETKKQRSNYEEILKLINGIPYVRERLKEQHQLGIIDTPKLTEKLEEMAKKELKHKKKLNDIEESIAKSEISKDYEKTLDLFTEKHKKVLDDIYKNRAEIYDIIHILFDKIIVHSRPVTDKDKIAGRKKEGQLLPDRLEMKLRLPKEILQSFASRFVVKNADL